VTDRDELVRGYAEAMFRISEAEGEADAVEDQLFAFAKAVEGDPKLREALTDPALPAGNKRALVAELMGDRANPHAVNLLGFLIDEGREREIPRVIEELAAVGAERRRHAVAEVRSAVPLDRERRERLERALSRATGKTVEVKVVVDPSVIGGVLAKVEDEVFDGTVRTKLAEARRQLTDAGDGRSL
jgi:F-type H+-transporting ATPase subunit delta